MVLGDHVEGNAVDLQKKSRQVELLNAFLKNDIIKDAETISIGIYHHLEKNLEDIYGDLGKQPEAQYRLFKGNDRQAVNDVTAVAATTAIYSI